MAQTLDELTSPTLYSGSHDQIADSPVQGFLESEDSTDNIAVGEPLPYYNLLATPEEPGGGAAIRVKSSSQDVGFLVFGRISMDTVTSNGRLLAPYGYIFLGPKFEESQWTNTISARQSTLGFLYIGPDVGTFKSLARFETYFLSSVADANVYGLVQYYLSGKSINEDWGFAVLHVLLSQHMRNRILSSPSTT